MNTTLKAHKRDIKTNKANQIRTSGDVPAVLYGRGIDNINLRVKYGDFIKALDKVGESQILQLEVESEKSPRPVLIHEIERDSLTNKILHVDFYQVRMDEKITADVSLEFIGESEAVKSLGGILVKNMHSLKIKALPADLPSEIKVDIGSLKTFEDRIFVKNINLPKGVDAVSSGEEIIALVAAPRSEEELAALEGKVEADVSAVKVVEKEKKEKAPEEEVQKEVKAEKSQKAQ
ncbi:50S ribosomal protein L25 [Candidatus Parcubacteria bacterium]|nr:MAG: 50S ribosomal protein L25 [Candidatus Parcubacteria bacterium]